MQAPQGIASFPGLDYIVSGSLSMTHGISPSVATLTVAPQSHFPQLVGDLTFQFDGQYVTWPNAIINLNTLRQGSSQRTWEVHILDRRWMWKWGHVSGEFNVREQDFSVRQPTQLSVIDMADLCLDCIKEQGYDISALADVKEFPYVKWDCSVPMQALEDLCDQFGYHVVLGLDNIVRICKVGEGRDLPYDGTEMEDNPGIAPVPTPKTLGIGTGRCRFQCDFELEAVGKDTDGTWKPIANLSYRPNKNAQDGGWSAVDPFDPIDFWDSSRPPNFPPNYTSRTEQYAKTVYRSYRLKMPVAIPGWTTEDTVKDIFQIELEDTQCVKYLDYDDLGNVVWRDAPAMVYGMFANPLECDAGFDNNCTQLLPILHDPRLDAFQTGSDTFTPQDATILPQSFSIDKENRMVHFSEPVYRNGGTGGITPLPATLRLRTACTLRYPDSLAPARWVWWREMYTDPSLPWTPHRYILHDEIEVLFIPWYAPNDPSFTVQSVQDNTQEIRPFCDALLDAASVEYETKQPHTMKYAGLRTDVNLDGAVAHVVFQVGPSGATTTISRNTEHFDYTTPYAVRRHDARIAWLAQNHGFVQGRVMDKFL